jgi:23S rRNA (guanine745-N1)-methyltransferase
VRACTRPLARRDRVFVCAAGHSYDVARSGYVNLLQPQDRRSAAAGDSRAAIEARASLLAAGVGRTLIDAVAGRAASFDLSEAPVVADLGCGSGDLLAAVTARAGTGVGIDLSTAAVERAARHFPAQTWVVANADRRLPLLDRSIDLVMSVHGRRNPSEVARVLVVTGYLVVAVPAADDLIELRELVQGTRIERDRTSGVMTEHETMFQRTDQWVVRETMDLDRVSLLNLLRGTYRGVRRGAAERVAALDHMRVTTASEVVVLRLR